MLCILATAAVHFAVASPPDPAPPPVWGEVAVSASGGDTSIAGQVAYEASPGVVAMVVSYEVRRGLPALVSVTAVAGRRLDPRTRLDFEVWRAVGRGGGVGFVVRRSFGR